MVSSVSLPKPGSLQIASFPSTSLAHACIPASRGLRAVHPHSEPSGQSFSVVPDPYSTSIRSVWAFRKALRSASPTIRKLAPNQAAGHMASLFSAGSNFSCFPHTPDVIILPFSSSFFSVTSKIHIIPQALRQLPLFEPARPVRSRWRSGVQR